MAGKPMHVALVLLGALLIIAPLHLMAGPGSPAFIEGTEWLRLLVGLPGVVFLPGIALAPLVMVRDLQRGPGLSLPWTLLAGAGLNILIYAVHFNALRLLGLPISWPALLALTTVETLACAALLHRRSPELTFAPSSSGLRVGMGVVVLALMAAAGLWRTEVTMDSSWNYYTEALTQPIEQPVDAGVLRFDRDHGGAPWESAEAFVPTGPVRLTIYNPAETRQEVPVLFLVHGPLGTSGAISSGEEVLTSDTVQALVPLQGMDGTVERYWEWGTVALVAAVSVDASSERTVGLTLQPPAGYSSSDLAVAEWSGFSHDELLEFTRNRGFRFMHPYQLLNVTENVRWAHEVSTDHVLSGRAPDGSSSLHQPPGWTYQYAPARVMLTPHLVSASGLFFVILALIALTVLLGAEESGSGLSSAVGALLGVGVGASVLQHARLMVADGSMNFPDNLYSLALVLCVVLLVTGRTRTFLVWAFLATILRYPGAVVVALAALSLAVLRVDLRRRVIDAAMRFGLAVAAFCGVMLATAVLTGALDQWLFALWFETVPEHFNNHQDADPLWMRPLVFLKLWMLVGGGAVLASLPFRGTLSRVALATAVLYAPFLAFIDHFSHHYFLPLIGLVALAAASNAAAAKIEKSRAMDATVFAAVATTLYFVARYLAI